LNIGNKIWEHIVLQKDGVKDLPWVLSVSNKQSRALDISAWCLVIWTAINRCGVEKWGVEKIITYSLRTSRSSPVIMIS